MTSLKAFRAFAALLALFALPSLAADPPKCKFVRIAELPVRLQRGVPVAEGSINGKKALSSPTLAPCIHISGPSGRTSALTASRSRTRSAFSLPRLSR